MSEDKDLLLTECEEDARQTLEDLKSGKLRAEHQALREQQVLAAKMAAERETLGLKLANGEPLPQSVQVTIPWAAGDPELALINAVVSVFEFAARNKISGKMVWRAANYVRDRYGREDW